MRVVSGRSQRQEGKLKSSGGKRSVTNRWSKSTAAAFACFAHTGEVRTRGCHPLFLGGEGNHSSTPSSPWPAVVSNAEESRSHGPRKLASFAQGERGAANPAMTWSSSCQPLFFREAVSCAAETVSGQTSGQDARTWWPLQALLGLFAIGSIANFDQ